MRLQKRMANAGIDEIELLARTTWDNVSSTYPACSGIRLAPLAADYDLKGENRIIGDGRRSERAPPQRQKRGAGQHAQHAGDPEGHLVVAEGGTNRAGAKRGERRADLVARADPSVDDAGVLAPEGFAGQAHGRWDGRNPVETIEHREPSEPLRSLLQRERQRQQRESAQRVVPE